MKIYVHITLYACQSWFEQSIGNFYDLTEVHEAHYNTLDKIFVPYNVYRNWNSEKENKTPKVN